MRAVGFERVGTALSAGASVLDAPQMQVSYDLEAVADAIASSAGRSAPR